MARLQQTVLLLAATLGAAPGILSAQTKIPPASASEHAASKTASTSPLRVDPLLVKPASEITPDDIQQMQKKLSDWAQLGRYRDDNTNLPPAEPGRVVFYGDSITDAWGRRDGTTFFPGKPYVNRGISGQTTPQMLVRFQQDVVALKPAAVLILAGTNDLAGNTGLSTLPMIEDNFRSMAAVAKANSIKVILASVLPVSDYPWRRGLDPAPTIRKLNTWLKQFAEKQGLTYLDYYTALADENGGMKKGTSKDGVHPSPAGYAIMAPLAQSAIDHTVQP